MAKTAHNVPANPLLHFILLIFYQISTGKKLPNCKNNPFFENLARFLVYFIL